MDPEKRLEVLPYINTSIDEHQIKTDFPKVYCLYHRD